MVYNSMCGFLIRLKRVCAAKVASVVVLVLLIVGAVVWTARRQVGEPTPQPSRKIQDEEALLWRSRRLQAWLVAGLRNARNITAAASC